MEYHRPTLRSLAWPSRPISRLQRCSDQTFRVRVFCIIVQDNMATRGLGSFSGAAAAAILLWCHCFVLHALFVTANSIPHQHLSSETPTGQVAFRRDPPAIGGKVRI